MRGRFAHATPYLFFCTVTFAFGDLLFGIDTGSFGSLQALPSWLKDFGEIDATGRYALPTARKSLMNSVPWIGKLAGCAVFEPIADRFGYRNTMYLVAIVQIIAIILEMATKSWQVFSVGRCLAYFAVGIVENAVPSYQSEISPAPLRGLLAGSLMLIVTLGNLWGSVMSRAYVNEMSSKGWLVPVGVQLVPAIAILVFTPFCVESPRWLLLRGRKEQAITSMDRLRPKEDAANGSTLIEVEALEGMIHTAATMDNGKWRDLFKGNYFRRVSVASWMFFFQQTCGTQFVNSYGPTFYIQMGLGSKAFTYQVITNCLSLLACFITITTTDRIGRRPILIFGTFFITLFNALVAGLGSLENQTTASINTVVASLMLEYALIKLSLGTLCFLIAAEIGGVQMRKKIIAVGTAWDVCAAFITTYASPYLLGPPNNLGPRIGWIFAAVSLAAFVFVTFFVPDLHGRSLEEVDELFERNLWAWQFNKVETVGQGRAIRELEAQGGVEHKPQV